ncbi:MAG: hypothetical protein ACXWLK_02045 [Rhizomicrobium sp.]
MPGNAALGVSNRYGFSDWWSAPGAQQRTRKRNVHHLELDNLPVRSAELADSGKSRARRAPRKRRCDRFSRKVLTDFLCRLDALLVGAIEFEARANLRHRLDKRGKSIEAFDVQDDIRTRFGKWRAFYLRVMGCELGHDAVDFTLRRWNKEFCREGYALALARLRISIELRMLGLFGCRYTWKIRQQHLPRRNTQAARLVHGYFWPIERKPQICS